MSESWEFLIQKEGDRTWLPLEGPTVEILEGRYRMVARSSRVQTPLEIRLAHQSFEEHLPKRRVQKRSHRTNKDGLMVVFPFTYLKVGLWEVSCTGDILSDLLGNPWQYKVQLEVLAIDFDADPSLEPEPQSEDLELTEFSKVASSEIELDKSKTIQTSELSQIHAQPELAPELIDVVVNLAQTVYIAPIQGQSLEIVGQIEQSGQADSGVDTSVKAYHLKLLLRDPQNFQILQQNDRDLLPQTLPIAFECHCYLPPECQTRLILGEIQIFEQEHPTNAIASQDFTITAGVSELLAAMSKERGVKESATSVSENSEPSDLDWETSETETVETNQKVNLFFFDLINQPKEQHSLDLKVSTRQPLPPQITRPDSQSSSGVKSPQLPSFMCRKVDEEVTPDTTIEQPLEEVSEVSATADSETTTTEETLESVVTVDETAGLESSSVEESDAQVESSFRRLKLHERFKMRLGAIAKEFIQLKEEKEDVGLASPNGNGATPQLSSASPLEASPVSPILEDGLSDIFTTEVAPQPLSQENQETPEPEPIATRRLEPQVSLTQDWEAEEIVVDDDGENQFIAAKSPNPEQPQPNVILESSQAQDLAETLTSDSAHLPLSLLQAHLNLFSIPTPCLEVPPGDWVAGDQVKIGVKLTPGDSLLRVKLWMSDRQTRTLLQDPQWMVDFDRDAFGNLTAITEWVVPFGCMEVWIEAIATEVLTGRESRKVTVSRTILPSDLLDITLEELDMSY